MNNIINTLVWKQLIMPYTRININIVKQFGSRLKYLLESPMEIWYEKFKYKPHVDTLFVLLCCAVRICCAPYYVYGIW